MVGNCFLRISWVRLICLSVSQSPYIRDIRSASISSIPFKVSHDVSESIFHFFLGYWVSPGLLHVIGSTSSFILATSWDFPWKVNIQGTSRPPCGRSVAKCQLPTMVQWLVPSFLKKRALAADIFDLHGWLVAGHTQLARAYTSACRCTGDVILVERPNCQI